jgi:CBS domain containing-hemolysin-like protein
MNPYLIIFITLLLSAFFSGMEIAFISANKLRIEIDRKQGHFSSGIISIFINNPSKYLTTMLVGNNLALVIYGAIMAILLEPTITRILSTNNVIVILTVQTLITTLIILIFAEFLPKMIFRNIANYSLNLFSIPIMLVYILFYPITFLINALSHSILNLIKGDSGANERIKNVFNKHDLIYFINQSGESIPETEEQTDDIKLFQNALDFSSVKIRDCMVPRTEIAAVDSTASIQEVRDLVIETGFSKILVYKVSIDNIIGFVNSKSLFEKNNDNTSLPLIDISFVPESMAAHRLLTKFIQDKKSVAVVVDEFGGVSGMLTIEDILEEIFGEIKDEHDTSELIEKEISEKEYIFSGRLEIDYLNEVYHLNIPESEEYDTLAGFIINHYESIPKLNERIIIEGFEMKILKVSNTKVELIHLKQLSD